VVVYVYYLEGIVPACFSDNMFISFYRYCLFLFTTCMLVNLTAYNPTVTYSDRVIFYYCNAMVCFILDVFHQK